MKNYLLIIFISVVVFFNVNCEKNLRILVIVNKFPRITETFILEQLKALIDAKFDVTILSVWKDETDIVQKDVIKYKLLEKVTYMDFYDEENHEEVCSFVNSGNFDLLYCQYDGIGRVFAKLLDQQKIRGKLVCCVRGGDLVEKIKKNRQDFHTLFSHISFILPVNNYFKKILVSEGFPEEKIIIQHSAIDLSMFHFCKKEYNKRRINIISVNRLITGKGVDISLRAIIKICKKFPQIQYYIIGNGKLFEFLEESIQKSRLEDRIHLMGWQPHEVIKQMLKKSHIFLLASIGTDGIPNAIMEASASGLPIISTTYGGIPEVVQNKVSGLLVKPGSISSLVRALVFLLKYPSKWHKMGKAGRKIIENNFDITKESKALVEILRFVILGEEEKVIEKFSHRYGMSNSSY